MFSSLPVCAALPAYAELHCLSNYSFLRGASSPDELVRRAAALGYSGLAITDECSFSGVVRAHVAAKAVGLPLVIGTEIRLTDGTKLVLLATDRDSYGNLSELITKGRRRATKGRYTLSREDLAECLALSDKPLEALPGCLALLIPGLRPKDADADIEAALWLAAHFPARAWIAAELLCGPDDKERLARLRVLSAGSGLPLTAAGDVHMHLRSRRRLQDTLTAVRVGKLIRECGHDLYPNAERHLRQRVRLANLYPPELLAESVRIAGRCRFCLDSLRYEYPEELVPQGETPASHLRKLSEAGARRRYPEGTPPPVAAQIEHELALIAELCYEPYFLTVNDIVVFARSMKILCQGRGSAANSAVCYVLGITEVNPALGNLLFERFISRERNEPPDIDIDFEHQRREEVIQYIYAKYGRERTALAATVITYRVKSALRDIGRALGLEPRQIDRLTRSLAWWDDKNRLPERLREHGFDPESPLIRALLELTAMVLGFPRHLSQHVGGFIITRGKLSRLVPIENAAMVNRSVIQWEKDDLEAIGLLKVDVLALGMLSAIRRALDMVGQYRNTSFTMHEIPREDPKVYEMIQHADTVGVFQIESRAQMSMLPRLKPECFYDLVIEVAIVRPGPIQGGMVHPYLRRKQGKEAVTYPSEAVKSVLSRTLGVPIFQEQVMQLAMVAAGFTPGEADQLRRSMAAWKKRGGLEHFETKLIQGMEKRGYPREFAERVYQQILGFGEYGFPESHSASFALLAYVSAWLKCHEPAAFLAALLNSQPMGFYAPAQLTQDARRHGVVIRPATVCASDWECTLEKGAEVVDEAGVMELDDARFKKNIVRTPAVRLGLLMVKGLSQAGGERIAAARRAAPFSSVDDVAERAALDRHDLRVLAAANAFADLAGHRREAYWAVAGIETKPNILQNAPVGETLALFEAPSEGEDLIADYKSLGLTLGRHPLALLRSRLTKARLSSAEAVRALPHGRITRAAGLVIGRQRPDTASGVVFVTLEDETGCVNVVVWHDLAARQRRELIGSRLLAVHGVLEREGEVVHLIARKLVDHSAWLGELKTSSRDFH
ncbi:MAG: error-prone DNA polymerase [Betaproteobacteria bacterium]|nr:error-prone DNA polymerase [Betaproteobacteria bacterium]